MCRFWALLSFFLSTFLVTSMCRALPPRDLLVRSWSPGSDVRQQSIQAMLQTRDGYLWIGTGKGLMRFDGVSFTAFTADNTTGMSGDDISFNMLWEDDAGVLWAGTNEHGVVRNDRGHFSSIGKEQGLPAPTVLRVDGDKQGGVWIYTTHGVSRWRNGHLEQEHPEQDGANTGSLIKHDGDRRTPDFDRMGLWRRMPDGVERFAYGAWQRFPMPQGDGRVFEHDVRSIYEDHLRRVWYSLRSQPGRYFCARDGELTIYDGVPKDAFVSYQDRDGFLWLNDHGAHPARWKQGKLYPLPELHTSFLLNVLERPDGSIWAGSFNTVLLQYRPRLISSIQTAGTPEVGSVLFQQRNGAIWAGGTGLLQLREGSGGEKKRSPLRSHLVTPGTWDIFDALSEDAEGRLLIASRHRLGGRMLDHGKLTPYLVRGFDNSVIRAMLLSSSGDQWIGTDTGLYRFRGVPGAKPERVWGGAVRCLAEAGPNFIWAGTSEGPVPFQGGHQVALAASAAWSFGEVQAISVDRLGELWTATSDHGIVRFAGAGFRAFGTTDGLPTNRIYSISFGDDDDLWIRSDLGLIRVRRRSLEHRIADPASKLQVTLLDQADGLPAPNMEPPGNQGFLRVDGSTLWFATPGGIATVHPSDFGYQASSPRAILEEHVIDQSSRIPGASIVLSPGQRNLELDYTALGSSHPEQINFRYRLRGFDYGWTAAGTRRVAYYTQLPPGSYSFEVQAADGDQEVWEATGAVAYIRVLTPFYRTWWMETLLGSAAVGTLLFFAMARRRDVLERIRVRQLFTHRLIAAQEGERKRIAHELHDSLGQHLVLIRNLALLPKLPVGAPTGESLARIADQAAAAIQEVQTISYHLRPYQLDRLGLTRTLISLTESFESSSAIRVTQLIQDIDGFFPRDMEINVYRIMQEALGNILKHAEATEVMVAVALTGAALQLVITDNGRGFASSTNGSTRGGFGLVGIQERAEALGGFAVIESVDPAGTRVIVTVTRAE